MIQIRPSFPDEVGADDTREERRLMSGPSNFLKDSQHLWVLGFLVIAGGAGYVVARQQVVQDTYGDLQGRYGPYRAAALEQIASQPMKMQADHVCLECHEHVGEERMESPHKAVMCMHCHGWGTEHVALARKAAASPDAGIEIPEVPEWDGDFHTDVDIYKSYNRLACLVCHEKEVGKPEEFKLIVLAEHLEEQDYAEEIDNPNVCLDCHGNHDPAP